MTSLQRRFVSFPTFLLMYAFLQTNCLPFCTIVFCLLHPHFLSFFLSLSLTEGIVEENGEETFFQITTPVNPPSAPSHEEEEDDMVRESVEFNLSSQIRFNTGLTIPHPSLILVFCLCLCVSAKSVVDIVILVHSAGLKSYIH